MLSALYPLSINFEIWLIFQIFDLGWPLVTSWPRFLKADVKSIILMFILTTYNEFRNLTLNDPKFEIWPQGTQILKL